ncbi:MAG: tRNA pseudouridine(55) synthase TruB [Deltaproteobacteria bacterium]|nr:MAG: tRNA pseudouridine(55) synthase TruB [Deltaproteobacteria bacterium]
MRIDGFLILDKPEGIASFDVVREVKRRLGVRKAGHIGTLDPFATGVLPIALNEGTKLIPFLNDEPKRYQGTLKLGEETATEDHTGEVVARRPWTEATSEAVFLAFQSFSGRIRQVPPMFSALKVEGKPLYRLARQGLEVERKEREVQVFEIGVEAVDLPWVRFTVSCSKGTYIRTLAKDIGRKIGCGAHLTQLRRIQSGFFSIDRAITCEELGSLSGKPEILRARLIPLEEALPGLPEVIGKRRLVQKVRLGQETRVRDLSPQSLSEFDRGTRVKMTYPGEGLVAILKSEMRHADIPWTDSNSVVFRSLRVFHPPSSRGGVGKDALRRDRTPHVLADAAPKPEAEGFHSKNSLSIT